MKNEVVLYFNPVAMNLMMYIGNDLIESVPLELERISKPGYVGNFKRLLKIKHNELIQQNEMKPEFLVFEPSPVMPKTINHQNPGTEEQ